MERPRAAGPTTQPRAESAPSQQGHATAGSQSSSLSLVICCLSAWMSHLEICLRSLVANRGAQGSVKPKVLSAQTIHYRHDERGQWACTVRSCT